MVGETPARKRFYAFNYILLTVIGLTMLLPFLHIMAQSFSDSGAILSGEVSIFPVDFTTLNYGAVFHDPSIWRSMMITVYVTVLGTFLNLLVTTLMAYGLSKDGLKLRSLILLFVLVTMIFQTPVIPLYLLVKEMGMLDTLWSLMIPNLVNAFNLIIMISFFRNIPEELLDSARMDGCGEYRALARIVLPLSLPALSTIGLFYAVAHWNGYYYAIMFIRNPDLFVLQVKLRKLIVESNMDEMMDFLPAALQTTEGIKAATIIVATLPILFVYPFLQRYFIKGTMLGSLKG